MIFFFMSLFCLLYFCLSEELVAGIRDKKKFTHLNGDFEEGSGQSPCQGKSLFVAWYSETLSQVTSHPALPTAEHFLHTQHYRSFNRRLLRVPWTARRSNQSILKISPGCSLEGMMLKLKLQDFGHLMEKTLMLGGIGGRRRRG